MHRVKYELYETDKIRKVLRCLGFVASNLSAREGLILYTHPERDSTSQYVKYITVPQVRVQSKNMALKIIERIKSFGFTEKEIIHCEGRLLK